MLVGVRKTLLIEHNYFDTYYYCLIIQNVVNDPFTYAKKIYDILGEHSLLQFLMPFKKTSNLHIFSSYIISDVFFENLYEIHERSEQASLSFVNDVLRLYGLESINNKAELDNFLLDSEYWEQWEILIDRLSDEVVQILFLNRQFLLNFNQMLADYLELNDDILDYIGANVEIYNLNSRRKSIRKAIPRWVQKAVFYRDKGCCINCLKDLTGLISVDNEINYDHIIPLAKFGMNDVTNIQLLCSDCNKQKLHHHIYTSKMYKKWW